MGKIILFDSVKGGVGKSTLLTQVFANSLNQPMKNAFTSYRILFLIERCLKPVIVRD